MKLIMSKLTSQYKKFMKDLEENIENVEDYNLIKSELSKLFMIFFNEIDEMKDLYEKKIDAILERQSSFNEKINKVEGILNNIQKDIYLDETSDFEITCPYCEKEFIIQMEELKDEVECPECKNLIELDWNGDISDCPENGCPGCKNNDCNYDEDDDM